jgi:hypothetical protein
MIKAGEWVIVASVENGDVGCQRVDRVADERRWADSCAP